MVKRIRSNQDTTELDSFQQYIDDKISYMSATEIREFYLVCDYLGFFITGDNFILLATVLRDKTLSNLTLKQCRLTNFHLCNFCSIFQSLTTLNLEGNKLGSTGASILSESLIHCTNLQVLELSGCYLCDNYIARGSSNPPPPNLTGLNKLLQTIQTLITLQKVSLRSNYIGNFAPDEYSIQVINKLIATLHMILQHSQSIVIFDISDNRFDDLMLSLLQPLFQYICGPNHSCQSLCSRLSLYKQSSSIQVPIQPESMALFEAVYYDEWTYLCYLHELQFVSQPYALYNRVNITTLPHQDYGLLQSLTQLSKPCTITQFHGALHMDSLSLISNSKHFPYLNVLDINNESFDNVTMEDKDFMPFFQYMSCNTSITILKLISVGLNESTCPHIREMLIHNKTLTYIDLSDNPLRDNGIIALCTNLTVASQIKTLILSDIDMTPFSATTIMTVLNSPTCHSLEYVDISKNLITGSRIYGTYTPLPLQLLFTPPPSTTSITPINANTINPATITSNTSAFTATAATTTHLISSPTNTSTNVTTSMTTTTITTNDATSTSTSTLISSSIQYINLSYLDIGLRGTTIMFSQLSWNQSLIYLNLYCCTLSLECCICIKQYIKDTCTLRYLNLRKTMPSKVGVQRVLEGMNENQSILWLDISEINGGQQQFITTNQYDECLALCTAIDQLLCTNKKLEVLCMHSISFLEHRDKTHELHLNTLLIHGILSNHTIRSIHLDYGSSHDTESHLIKISKEWRHLLRIHPTLRSLHGIIYPKKHSKYEYYYYQLLSQYENYDRYSHSSFHSDTRSSMSSHHTNDVEKDMLIYDFIYLYTHKDIRVRDNTVYRLHITINDYSCGYMRAKILACELRNNHYIKHLYLSSYTSAKPCLILPSNNITLIKIQMRGSPNTTEDCIQHHEIAIYKVNSIHLRRNLAIIIHGYRYILPQSVIEIIITYVIGSGPKVYDLIQRYMKSYN